MNSRQAINHIKQYIQDYRFMELGSGYESYHASLGITFQSLVKPEHMQGMPAYDEVWLKLCRALHTRRIKGVYRDNSPLEVLSHAPETQALFRNISGQVAVMEAPLLMRGGEYARYLAQEGLQALGTAWEGKRAPELSRGVKESLTHIPDELGELSPQENQALHDALEQLLGLLPDAIFAQKYQIAPELIHELTGLSRHLMEPGTHSTAAFCRFSPVEINVTLVKCEFPDGSFSPDTVWDSGAGIHDRADVEAFLAGFSLERLEILRNTLDEMADLARRSLPHIREYHLNQLRQQADSIWDCGGPFQGLFPDGSWLYTIKPGTDFPMVDNAECPLRIYDGKKQYCFEMKDVAQEAAGRDVLTTLIVGGSEIDMQRAHFALLTALEASPCYQALPSKQRPRLFSISSTGENVGCPAIACKMEWDEECIQKLFNAAPAGHPHP